MRNQNEVTRRRAMNADQEKTSTVMYIHLFLEKYLEY